MADTHHSTPLPPRSLFLPSNSVYHMTDCPSFLSQDQLVILEPHAKIFNGRKTRYRGGVKGNFVSKRRGLERYADQIKPFAALDDDLDLAVPYDGTIFRFPLRTKASEISPNAYSVQQVKPKKKKKKKEPGIVASHFFFDHGSLIISTDMSIPLKTDRREIC